MTSPAEDLYAMWATSSYLSAPDARRRIDAALAAERKATVERIRVAIIAYGFDLYDWPVPQLFAILDAEQV